MEQSEAENPFLPRTASRQLFSLLWQLERWMREMVYVELRAHYADWQGEIRHVVQNNWPPRSQAADKQFTHMSTPHESGISYLTLGELLRIVRSDKHWHLFESYFPPKDIFIPRMSEVSQIRHRIAHFRDPHDTDVERVSLLLRDLDKGFWRFVTAYSRTKTRGDGPSDSVSDFFKHTHDRRWSVEMHALDGEWLYAGDRRDPRLNFDLSCSMRPGFERTGVSLVGRAGLVYHARFSSRVSNLPADTVLEQTERVHSNCIHIRLETHSIEVMVPSVIGHDLLASTIDCFLDRCIESASPGERADMQRLDQIADKWPEYVLGPSNPMGLLDENMPCSIFALA